MVAVITSAAALALAGCGGEDGATNAGKVRAVAAGEPGLAEVERAASERLAAQEPLMGAPARETFCAIEVAAADGPLDATDGRVTQAWGWASCQQVRAAGARRLRGGGQSSEPVRVVLHRDGGQLTIDALDAPQQGLDYEASMRTLFPEAARRRVDGLSGADFDARIDRLLCANLAAAGERFDRPGARLIGQGERCP